MIATLFSPISESNGAEFWHTLDLKSRTVDPDYLSNNYKLTNCVASMKLVDRSEHGAARTPGNKLNFLASVVSLLTVVSVLLEQQYIFDFGSVFSVHVYQIYLLDVLSLAALILFCLSLRSQSFKKLSPMASLSVLVLAVLTGAGVLVWTFVAGLETAVVYWRPWLWAIPLLMMSAAYATKQSWYQLQCLIISAGILASVAVIGVTVLRLWGLDSNLGCEFSANSTWYCLRVLTPGAVLLLILAIPMVANSRMCTAVKVSLTILLSLSVTLSYGRSAWFALGVGLFSWFMFCLNQKKCLSQLPLVATATSALILSMFTSFLASTVISQPKSTDLPRDSTAFADTGTLEWRLELWLNLIEGMTVDLSSVVGGSLSGVSPEWDNPNAQDQNFRTSAHNEILYDLTTLGLLGTVAVVILWLSAWSNRSLLLGSTAMWLWALLAYSLLNSLPTWTWLIIGVAIVKRLDFERGTEAKPTI